MSRAVRGGAKYSKGSYRAGGRGQHARVGMSSMRSGSHILLSVSGVDAGIIPRDPSRFIGKQIRDALDPTKAPSKPKTFAEMSDAEREEMCRLYERGGR